jgi:hypothetical protein
MGAGVFRVETRVKVAFLQGMQRILQGYANPGVCCMMARHATKLHDPAVASFTLGSHPLAIYQNLTASLGWSTVWKTATSTAPFLFSAPVPPLPPPLETPLRQTTQLFGFSTQKRLPGAQGGTFLEVSKAPWDLQEDGWFANDGFRASEPNSDWLVEKAEQMGCHEFIEKWGLWSSGTCPPEMLRVFVDGSAKNGEAAAGIWVPETGMAYTQRPPGIQHPGRAEIWAVIGALQKGHGPLWIITDYNYITAILGTSLAQRLVHQYADLVDQLYQRLTTYPWPLWITWVKGHMDFAHHDVVDTVAKKGVTFPHTVTPCVPTKLGDLVHAGAEIWGPLVVKVLQALVPKHQWQGIDAFWSYKFLTSTGKGVVKTSPRWTLGRLKWVSGTQDWRGGAFAYHKEYKISKQCRVCGTSHPLDFLTVLAVCPLFTKFLTPFFDLFAELKDTVQQWWTTAPPDQKRLWIRTLIPKSLAHCLLTAAPRKRVREILTDRYKKWPKTHEDFCNTAIANPLPSPTGRLTGVKTVRDPFGAMADSPASKRFKLRMDQWVDQVWDSPPRPAGRSRGSVSLAPLRKQKPKLPKKSRW